MPNLTFILGILGSIILVTGSAWPEGGKKEIPVKSVKDWLFASGSTVMLIYAILNYTGGGSIFFVILQILVAISCIMMMLNTDDRIDLAVISVSALALIIWSLTLFQGYSTIFFIIGLAGIGLGYVFQMGTLRRETALTGGSALIALFSYLEANWIFFILNIFFAAFSAYYLAKILTKKHPHAKKHKTLG